MNKINQMDDQLLNHLDAVLSTYTKDEHFDGLLKAKEEYFSLTGSLNDDDDEYEIKMNCFNDWYIFQHIPEGQERSIIHDYILKKEIEDKMANALQGVNHSLFEFLKINFRKQVVLKDILHAKKIVLAKDHTQISLIPGDLFVGRTIEFDGQNYLLKGLCLFPSEVRTVLSKQAKKVRKLMDPHEELGFLLSLEQLKTKWKSYGHIDISKIFVFNNPA